MGIKKKELRKLPTSELKTQLDNLRKELIKENAQVASGTTPKNPGNLKAIKKTVSRILTLIHEKEENKKK